MGWVSSALSFVVPYTYPAVLLGTLIDATGFPFPGRLLLVVAGSLTATGRVELLPVALLGVLGTMVGDHLWYFAGFLGAERLLGLYCRLSLSSQRCMATTGEYFRKYGALAILIGRFVAGVRIFAWPVAGASGVGYARFVLYDFVGAVVWCGAFVGIGYALGGNWMRAKGGLAAVGMTTAALSIALIVAPLGFRLLRRSRFGAARAGELRQPARS
jgi:membrane protein DedA with SNARE-associated domain